MLKLCKNLDLVSLHLAYMHPSGVSEDDTLVTYIGNKIFSFIGNVLYNLKISDISFPHIILAHTKSR